MKPANDHFIAFECLNSIGNSLELDEMLSEVISTFMRWTGAIAGKYCEPESLGSILKHIGSDFSTPEILIPSNEPFGLHQTSEETVILDIPVESGHFLFLFQKNTAIESFGIMFSTFRLKLFNAINACRNVENLRTLNVNLERQLDAEKNKNKMTEKLMISQSRMAVMGEMIGMIAHQWRQPITVIGIIANNTLLDIQLENTNSKQLINDLKLIDKHIHFLSRTIDDFRNFFRPNKLPQSVTFGEIAKDLMTIMGKSFDSQQIFLSFEGDSEIAFTTYKNELLQVFLNILNNAKDAFTENINEHPTIRFNLSENDKNSLLFLISNNAGSIPSHILERIFEPYFSTKSEKNGTGLGLYMSSIIVEKHLNGSLRACSDADETTFAVHIPKNSHAKQYNVY